MVDALREACRAVRSQGRLLDLRPLAEDLPIELESEGTSTVVGRLGGAPGLLIDERVSAALETAIERNWLVTEQCRTFSFAFYFDSADDLEEFLEDRWRSRHIPPSASCFESARSLARDHEITRLAVRHTLLLTRYRNR